MTFCRPRWIVVALLCAGVAVSVISSSTLAQEDSGKKKSATYGENSGKASAVLTLTPSGKQFAVSGYYYITLFPEAGLNTSGTPIKGVYSPSTGKVRARVIITNKDGSKTEMPMNGNYDPKNDSFKIEIDTRFIVPKDQLSPEAVATGSGSIVRFVCPWSHGDKLDLTGSATSDTETQVTGTKEETHDSGGTGALTTLKVKVVATMSCKVEDPRSDPSAGTVVRFNEKSVTTGGDGVGYIDLPSGTYTVKVFADNTIAGSLVFTASKRGGGGVKYQAKSKAGDYSATFSGSDKNSSPGTPDYVLAFRMVYCGTDK